MAETDDNEPDRSYAIVPAKHGAGFDIMLQGTADKPAVRVSTHDTMQQADTEMVRLISGALGDST